MITQLSLRPGNAPVPDHHKHPAISSFEELQG
jgi:methionine salvage enolase-phosphatase E1